MNAHNYRHGPLPVAMPADFPEKGRRMSREEAMRHYGVSQRIMVRWRKEAGIRTHASKKRPPRPLPADFLEIAPTLSYAAAEKRWKAGAIQIRTWYRDAGIGPARATRWKPIPEGFAEIAPTMRLYDLARRYEVQPETVRRWCYRLQIEPMRRRPKSEPFKRQTKPKTRKLPLRGVMVLPTLSRMPERDSSREGQAADHLRRYCAVYRCTETGAADQKGKFWRVGNAVKTGAELIAQAERHGWNPDAWMEIANPSTGNRRHSLGSAQALGA